MKLAEKGPLVPPPKLPRAAEKVAQEVRRWKGVVSVTHWHLYDGSVVDGADFYVGEQELGHLHLDGELHLGTTPSLRDALTRNGLARLSGWNPKSSWVETSVARLSDVELAVWLFRLGYDRLRGASTPSLLKQIEARCARPNAA